MSILWEDGGFAAIIPSNNCVAWDSADSIAPFVIDKPACICILAKLNPVLIAAISIVSTPSLF